MRGQSGVNEMNTLPIYYNIRHVNCHTLRDGQQIFHISREAILFCCRSDVFLARPWPGTSSHSSPSDSQLAVLSDEQTRLTRGDHSHVTSVNRVWTPGVWSQYSPLMIVVGTRGHRGRPGWWMGLITSCRVPPSCHHQHQERNTDRRTRQL